MSPFWGLFLTVILLLINAFFVAAEFATTSTRRAQIEPLVDQGIRGSRQALFALEHVSLMLAICQLGITVASTTLGFVAEPAIAQLIDVPLKAWHMPEGSAHVIAFTAALVIVLFTHVVIGEMIPKNISIAKPHQMLLLLAPILVAMGRLLSGIISCMDHLANWFLRLFGVEPQSEISSSFTVQEVATIIERSQQAGTIDDELGLITGTLTFSEQTVRDEMVSRESLVVLPQTCTPAMVEKEVAKTGYSRFPLASETGSLVGYIHLKDILYAEGDERDKPVDSWRIRQLDNVQSDDEIDDVLPRMQSLGTHCMQVVDSSGSAVGVLFLEDILEELVGEVRDSLQRDLNN